MSHLAERYVNPFTDYGFKRLFGEEPNKIPDKLKERIIEKLFEVAEIARFTPDQVRSYEDSLKYYRDLKNSLDTAKQEGLEEGIEKGRQEGIEKGRQEGREEREREIVKKALAKGLSVQDRAEVTGLSNATIERIMKE